MLSFFSIYMIKLIIVWLGMTRNARTLGWRTPFRWQVLSCKHLGVENKLICPESTHIQFDVRISSAHIYFILSWKQYTCIIIIPAFYDKSVEFLCSPSKFAKLNFQDEWICRRGRWACISSMVALTLCAWNRFSYVWARAVGLRGLRLYANAGNITRSVPDANRLG